MATSGCLKAGDDYTQLRIDTIDISANHIKSSYVDFNVTTYIENYGKIGSKIPQFFSRPITVKTTF
jgi:hypothetical protein